MSALIGLVVPPLGLAVTRHSRDRRARRRAPRRSGRPRSASARRATRSGECRQRGNPDDGDGGDRAPARRRAQPSAGRFRPGAPRPGRCDGGTPVGPANRQVCGGAPGLFTDPIPDPAHGSHVVCVVNGINGLERTKCDLGCDVKCDWACDSVTRMHSQPDAAPSAVPVPAGRRSSGSWASSSWWSSSSPAIWSSRQSERRSDHRVGPAFDGLLPTASRR